MGTPKQSKRVYLFLCQLVALVIMVYPIGVALPEGTTGGEMRENWFAYFSITPLSAWNFLPLLAGVLHLAAMVMLLLTSKWKFFYKPMILSTGISILLSPLSWLIFRSFTSPSAVAVVFQLLSLGLIWLSLREEKKAEKEEQEAEKGGLS